MILTVTEHYFSQVYRFLSIPFHMLKKSENIYYLWNADWMPMSVSAQPEVVPQLVPMEPWVHSEGRNQKWVPQLKGRDSITDSSLIIKTFLKAPGH